jgi:hypothetical protein
VLRVLLAGFAEIRGLANAAVERLSNTEAIVDNARLRLKETTRAQIQALKQELQAAAPHHQWKPAQCYIALEGVSTLIQPDEKAQDEFAVTKLFSSGQLIERTVNFLPEQMTLLHRQKLWQFMKRNREALDRVRARGDAASAFVQWLDAIAFVTEELPKVIGLYRAKEAVQAHIVPLAQWAMRPQLTVTCSWLGCSMGRAVQPPLIDPDMIGRQRGLAPVPRAGASLRSKSPLRQSTVKSPYGFGFQTVQKPILGQAIECEVPKFEPVPPAFAAPTSARRPQPKTSQIPATTLNPKPISGGTAHANLQQWVQRHAVSTGPCTTAGFAESTKPGSQSPSRRPSTCSTECTENQGDEKFAPGYPLCTDDLFAQQREKDDCPIDFDISSDEEDEPIRAQDEWVPHQKAQEQWVPNKKGEDEWLQPRMAMAG